MLVLIHFPVSALECCLGPDPVEGCARFSLRGPDSPCLTAVTQPFAPKGREEVLGEHLLCAELSASTTQTLLVMTPTTALHFNFF